jgi:hypothetical protein
MVFAHLVGDAALNEDPRARHAVLPGKGRNAGGQERESGCERRIIEHDHRSPAAELQVHPFQRLGTSGRDQPADLNAAGEADHVDVG